MKICERFVDGNVTSFIDTFLSKFIFVYCKFLLIKSRIDSCNGQLKKMLRPKKKKKKKKKKKCRSGNNELIKSFCLHAPRSLDSKNMCLWFLNRCCYIILFVFKKTQTKYDDNLYMEYFPNSIIWSS